MADTIATMDALAAQLPQLRRAFCRFSEYARFPTERLWAAELAAIDRARADPGASVLACEAGGRLRGVAVVEGAAWDSEVLGLPVARLAQVVFDEEDEARTIERLLDDVFAEVERRGARYLTIALPAHAPAAARVFNALVARGAYFINTLLTFALEGKREPPSREASAVSVRTATPADRDAIVDLAARSYRITRFHLDPNLDRAACDRLHARSAENQVAHGFADVVFVAEYAGRVIGYYSGRKHHDPILGATIGTAIISAVDEEARGLGAFARMNDHLLAWFAANCDLSEMGTYVNNTPVHRTWIRNGLPIVRATHQLAWYRG
jgi:GNAT superfamily N-acetyltransferase